jgi:hypothetical protein
VEDDEVRWMTGGFGRGREEELLSLPVEVLGRPAPPEIFSNCASVSSRLSLLFIVLYWFAARSLSLVVDYECSLAPRVPTRFKAAAVAGLTALAAHNPIPRPSAALIC